MGGRSGKIRTTFKRSTNLERDSTFESLDGYLPTSRALELIERVVASLEEGHGISISVVGPYGSGKSSAALFLLSLLGSASDPRTKKSVQLLAARDSSLARRLVQVKAQDAWRRGIEHRSVVARHEAVSETLARAFRNDLHTKHGPKSTATGLYDIVMRKASRAPLLLVVDEFGKNLEHYVDEPVGADLFLLQQLAELSADLRRHPVVLITLQHLAFEEYLSVSTPQIQQEWAKVQGRFVDLVFSESPRQARRLIAAALSEEGARPTQLPRKLASAHYKEAAAAGLGDVIESEESVESVFPLHPVAAAALPELCTRYAQNERTLFSFLRSDDRQALPALRREMQAAPLIGVEALYDYFVESVRSQLMAARGARRWLEVEARIRDAATSLPPLELRLLKVVGILNLASAGGSLRASRAITEYAALTDPNDGESRRAAQGALDGLVSAGLITFRQFADEYRVWAGSDFDLSGALEVAHRELGRASLGETLEAIRPQPPVVAGRFSVQTGGGRAFQCRFVDDVSALGVAQPVHAAADGLLALWVGGPLPRDIANGGPKPVLVIEPRELTTIRRFAQEVAAHRRVLDSNVQLRTDWVARRELLERLSAAEQKLDEALWSGVWAEASAAHVRLISGGEDSVPLRRTKRISGTISAVCATVYSSAPRIPNEVINREELTSQGASARRTLLEAMLTSGEVPQLGFSGYGPEKAIYLALLGEPGIHRQGDASWQFGKPKRRSPLAAIWDALEEEVAGSRFRRVNVKAVFERMALPPYGLRQGPLPVLFTALLLAHQDDLAVYEHGAYQPVLTPDFLERLAKNPQNFELKSFALGSSKRKEALEHLAEVLAVPIGAAGRRNETVLAVVKPILKTFRALPDFAKQTRDISATAIAVREALQSADEPDELVFHSLPKALGLAPFDAAGGGPNHREFATAMYRALGELQEAFRNMLGRLRTAFAQALHVPEEELRQALRERAPRLISRASDPSLRSFLLTAQDPNQPDDDWLQNLGMNLTGRGPRAWKDDDVLTALTAAREKLGAMRRLEFLYAGEADDHRAPYRITLTNPDGQEAVIVGFEGELTAQVRQLAEEVAARAETLVGPGGKPAITRALIELLGVSSSARPNSA